MPGNIKYFLYSFLFASLPLLLFLFLDLANYQIAIKNLAYLNPVLYLLTYSLISFALGQKKNLTRPIDIIFLSCVIMFFALLLGYLSPPALQLIRSIWVNDLGDRSVQALLGYSGSPGLFSEPSYQALLSVSILSSCLVSPLRGNNLKIFLVSLASILLTKSLTGISFAAFYICIRSLFGLFNSLIRAISWAKFRLTNAILCIFLLAAIFLLQAFASAYARLAKLFAMLADLDFLNLIESLQQVESSFGSNRFATQLLSCKSSVIELLFAPSNNPEAIASCSTGFSTFQQLQFTLGSFAAIVILCLVIFNLWRYCSSLSVMNQCLAFIRPTRMSVFFTVVNVVILGPVASPFIYMPLLRPFHASASSHNK